MYKSKSIDRIMFYGASPAIFENAKSLRQNMTASEKKLWEHLKNKKMCGFRFKAQHPIGQFIADFYCHKAKLIIEIDGEIHEKPENKEYDENRSYEIERLGLKIIRFKNCEIKNSIEIVLKKIEMYLV